MEHLNTPQIQGIALIIAINLMLLLAGLASNRRIK